MGGKSSKQPDLDKIHFLWNNSHKTYVVYSPGSNYMKVGYTGQDIYKGVWKSYRRAYGADLIILKMYSANVYKEDEIIHKKINKKYGYPNKGREIYHLKYKKDILNFLDDYHDSVGYGPFVKDDIIKAKNIIYKKEELRKDMVIIDGIEFLDIHCR